MFLALPRPKVSFDVATFNPNNETILSKPRTERGRSLHRLVRVAKHRVFKSPFPVAVLHILAVIDAQAVLQPETGAVGGLPFAQEIRKIAVQDEMVFATVVRDVHADFAVVGFP